MARLTNTWMYGGLRRTGVYSYGNRNVSFSGTSSSDVVILKRGNREVTFSSPGLPLDRSSRSGFTRGYRYSSPVMKPTLQTGLSSLAKSGLNLMKDVMGPVGDVVDVLDNVATMPIWMQSGPVYENLTPGGWIRCGGGPTDACYATWGASHLGYDGLTSCLVYGSCPSGQVMPGPVPTIGSPPPAGSRRALSTFITNYAFGGNPNVWAGTLTRQWRRVAGDAAKPYPPLWRVAVPMPRRNEDPWADPLVRPAQYRSPWPYTKVDVDGRIAAKPAVRPSTDIIFSGNKPPVIRAGEHVDEPDRVPTKKRKGVHPAMVAAIKLMHGLSEAGDFFEAMYDALPPQARCKGKRGLVHDMLCVLSHPEAYLDPDVAAAAIGNLVANHIEDKVIGTLFGSNWRTGVRGFNDNYGGAAWVGGGYGSPSVDPGYGGLFGSQNPF